MLGRKWQSSLPVWSVAGSLLLASSAWAEGGHSSAFGMFFETDSAVGTGVIWFLLLTSTALIALVIQAFLVNRPQQFVPPELLTGLEMMLSEKKYRDAIELVKNDESPFGQMMQAALTEAPRGYVAMEQALEEASEGIASTRIRKLVWMEIAGAAGPMLGLFGTVFGMILAFSKMVSTGGTPKPTELAGGIATALVCTFWGLVVGIPGVIFGSLFRVRIEALIAETYYTAHKLLAQFRPSGAAAATSAAKKPAAPAPAVAQPAPRAVEATA